MEKETITDCKNILTLLVTLFFISCNAKYDIPFPGEETELEQPATRSFRLPAPVKINWISSKQDSIGPPITKPFDIDQIAAKPFYIDGFKPFAKTPAEERIDWNNLPSVSFNLDTVPAKPLLHKTIKIDLPLRIKAGIAKTKIPVSKNIVQLSQEEGLPGGVVHQIYQDKKGIYWIATGKWLCRYDGEYFELFTFISKEPQGNIEVLQIIEDKLGKLWIRTQTRGTFVFDYSSGIVENIFANDYDIAADDSGNIWMVSYAEVVNVVNPETLMAQKINSRLLSDSGMVARVIKGDDHQILFRTGEGITIFDKQKKKIFQWHSQHKYDYSNIFYFLRTRTGNIMTGTQEGIDLIKPGASALQHLGFENTVAGYSVIEDNEGRIWQCKPDSGIEVLDLERNAVLKMDKQDGLSENSISCLFNDNNGHMWMGTAAGGINIINNNISINHLSVRRGLNDNAVWSLIEDNSGNIWAGNGSGIDILNTKQQTIKHLSNEIQMGKGYAAIPKLAKDKDGQLWAYSFSNALSIINIEKKTVKIYDEKRLPFRQGIRLLGDSRGRIWVSGYGQGVLLFDPKTNVFKHIDISNGLAGNLAWRLLEDKDGRIWIATSKGLSIIEADASMVSTIRRADGLSDNVTQSLVQDEQGRMWVATNEGIDMIDMTGKTITSFTKKQGMTENESFALEISGGKIYAGTSSGINIIENIGKGNNSNWRVRTFARPQGFYFLDVNSNTSLISKNKEFFWGIQDVLTVMKEPGEDSIIKPAYITGISVNGEQQYFYNPAKGLQGRVDSIWSERKDTFYNKENVNNSFSRKNHIQWDSSGGLFNMPNGLKLAYDQNQVNFQFTGMHTDDAEKARYRYILEGLDNHWSAVTQKAQSPDYNNLSPGSYSFKVSTKGANGLWSKPAVFSFTILPPWWKTWWAYVLYALVAVFIIRAYVLYRSRRLQRENLMLEEKVDQRTRELKQSLNDLRSTQAQLIQSEKMASLGELTAGIAHEIQNPLNFVNNFSEVNGELIDELQTEIDKEHYEEVKAIAKDIKDNEAKINHHGKRADAIVKGMLQHSRTTTSAKEPADINKLADEYLRLAYHGLRAKHKSFNATLKTDYDESIGNISIIPQDIGRVILNLINNAFYAVDEKRKNPQPLKGSEEYQPSVTVSTMSSKSPSGDLGVIISVKDNGNGIPQKILDKIFQPFFTTKPTGQGTGLGLSLSYDIVKAHGGELKVETEEGKGTSFIISLPI